MWREDLPVELARLVTPRAVRAYAEGLGWQRVEGVNGKIAVYRNPESPLRQLIVPLDEGLDDYAERTAEAIHRPEEWLHISEEALIARRCAYWVSLRGASASPNRESQTVYIPRPNLLSAQGLT